MINQTKLIAKVLGTKAHVPTNVLGDDYDRKATCLDCGQALTSYYNDDPDRLIGWTAWRATSPCVA